MPPSQQELSNLLGILYDAAADPGLWGQVIECLARHAGATSGGLLFHDLEHTRSFVSSDWRLDPDLVGAYQQHYHALDIWAKRGRFLPAGHVCTSESLCSLPEMRTKEIYNDFFVKSEIEHGMFVFLESSKSCLSSVSLFRNRSRPEFSESELQIVRFLAPHLQRAFKLHVQLSAARAYSAGVEAALDMLPTGIVTLGSRGEIIFMNQSAACTIAEKDGLLAVGNTLRAEQSVEAEHLAAMVESALSMSTRAGISAGGSILISRRTRPPLLVVFSPIRNTKLQALQKVAVVALINDPLRSQRPVEALLRSLYGLTPAECRIALLLSDGHAPRQVADKIGVAENTVRSQIKSIFNKTGAKRQSDLVRLLLNYSSPKFYKGESQEKKLVPRPEFFYFRSTRN